MSASNGRWNAAQPRTSPATNVARRPWVRVARTTAAAPAMPSTNESWYPSSVADCSQTNGESATMTAAIAAMSFRRSNSYPNA